ncbi:MAG: glycosyltransferase family 2 protein [Thermoanaerobaculia bacterium]
MISPSGLREDGSRWERSGGAPLTTVTVVMPVYNESTSIDESLASVLSQDYPEDLVEILIADGGSQDGTVERIGRVIAGNPERHIRLLNNPRRTAGAALNLMIREAAGEIVVRVDGHAEIAHDYVRSCVQVLKTSDALNVGGCISTAGFGFMGGAIAAALGSFWGNGGARFRSRPADEAEYVDTVPLGAWRRETFDRLGSFEEWRVNEDCEFNARILQAGGRILLHPRIKATYFSRRSLRSLAQQYFQYGRLKCRVIACHPRQLRVRQVVPLAFVLMLLAVFLTERLTRTNTPLLLIASIGYLFTIGIASVPAAFRARQPGYTLALPAVFATLHLSYGIGALLGSAELLLESVFARLTRLRPVALRR